MVLKKIPKKTLGRIGLKIQHSRNLAILKFVDLTSGCYISLDFEVVQTEKKLR